ncbi:DUF3617 domain-containing protein [Aquabacterium sp.]|uniref:DUF3617 domain-containing protein n=1 Tax=Aquabacterium sp. TaxID=1872578 RepID=UPI003D6D9782
MRSIIHGGLVLLCVSAFSAAVHADEAPPIKPGLWQVHSERAVDGVKAPPMTAQMNNLPPEVRKQMEAMMKQKGVDMSGGGGDIKLCLSKESLDQNQWLGQKNGAQNCKTEIKTRNSGRWTWHSSCSDPKAETDGEAVFNSPESYTVKVATIMTVKGESKTMNMTNTSTWLGANCGDLKPISAKTLSAPPAPKPMK